MICGEKLCVRSHSCTDAESCFCLVYLTIHATRELKNDRLIYDDVINCILTGEIIEQQLDQDEEKYLIYGDAQNKDEMAVVAKLGYNDATVVMTTFRLRQTMTSETNNSDRGCINCGKASAVNIRRDEMFGSGKESVIIENIPMMKCFSCGMVYLEPEVSRMIDEICAHPERHTSIEEKPVAKIA